jgi:hypothetical protein
VSAETLGYNGHVGSSDTSTDIMLTAPAVLDPLSGVVLRGGSSSMATNAVAGVKGFVNIDRAARFWSKVDMSGECWIWMGARSRPPGSGRDYGQFREDGHNRPAHVVAWELHHGRSFPEGMLGCHHCDNPPCVRPSHIFVGTMGDNIDDAYSKGRMPSNHRAYCINGHAMVEDNIYRNVYKGWVTHDCRTCRAARGAARRKRAS